MTTTALERFSITPGGVERVVYSFDSQTQDGFNPAAGLIDVNGTLYGTTGSGGTYRCGTVFSVTTAGVERVIYNFRKSILDGCTPQAPLLNVKGVLYGTTPIGGLYGGGIAFSLTRGGIETILHNFGYGSDGSDPDNVGLIQVNDTIYGTTVYGGPINKGTVFALTPER